VKQHNKKFAIVCTACHRTIGDFLLWFEYGQQCPDCSSNQAEVVYYRDFSEIAELLSQAPFPRRGMWRYFDFLPLNDSKNIITSLEGQIPIDRWSFLEELARVKFNTNCQVYAHRQDNNFATGTFKDLAGSMVASVLKENGIMAYVVASTGNIGVAYARYTSEANITLYAFIPENSSIAQEAEIGCFGQKVFRVKGDYTDAKDLAQQFAKANNLLLAAGNFDPMRIEAKKTMVYDWLRLVPTFPTVYIQALSGGTGPLGIDKACKELESLNLFDRMPRFLLVQSDRCSPMADAWKDAKAQGFPSGWEESYPVYHNPVTSIATLATGYPKAYPVVSKLVRKSSGEILSFPEDQVDTVARLVAYESAVRIGPAAAVAVGGFLKSLKEGYIKENDIVLVNIGEGMRRAPDFMKQLAHTTSEVKGLVECELFDRNKYGTGLWESVEKLFE
jgi:threonine synthase